MAVTTPLRRPNPEEVQTLTAQVRACSWLLEALAAVRALELDAVIGAGVLRDLVWDGAHGREPAPRDIDVAFFDAHDLSNERSNVLESELKARLPLPFEVTNQAAVHLWYEAVHGYPIPQVRSLEEAVSLWPETATAVAVRLEDDDSLTVLAPVGLEDLLSLVLRRNSRQVSSDYFRARAQAKDVAVRWPRVRVVNEPEDGAE